MNMKTWAMVFGVVFLAVGVLGFVPGISQDGMLLGLFEVDTTHNVIHLVSGILALAVATVATGYARLYFQVFGVVYALVTVLGFVQGTVLGLFTVNMADNVLHLAIAVLALWVGFMMKSSGYSVSAMPQQPAR